MVLRLKILQVTNIEVEEILSVCEQIKQLHCSECKHYCQNLNPRSFSIYPSHCNEYAAL